MPAPRTRHPNKTNAHGGRGVGVRLRLRHRQLRWCASFSSRSEAVYASNRMAPLGASLDARTRAAGRPRRRRSFASALAARNAATTPSSSSTRPHPAPPAAAAEEKTLAAQPRRVTTTRTARRARRRCRVGEERADHAARRPPLRLARHRAARRPGHLHLRPTAAALVRPSRSEEGSDVRGRRRRRRWW